MEPKEDGPDTSSIPSIESLRSRFETLGKGTNLAHPAAVFRKSPVPSTASFEVKHGRPKTASGEPSSTLDFDQTPHARSENASVKDLGLTTSIKARPRSMMPATSLLTSPPILTVDEPSSPPKTSALVGLQIPSRPLTPSSVSNSSQSHNRNVSRTATPALEARMTAFINSSTSSNSKAEPVKQPVRAADSSIGNHPPPVNRAAKPKIPAKSVSISRPSTLAAPEVAAEHSDRSASPFSTPPSSGKTSPVDEPEALVRSRHDSDASFVERLRSDSEAADSPATGIREDLSSLRRDPRGIFAESSVSGETTFSPIPPNDSILANIYRQQNGQAQHASNSHTLAHSRRARVQDPEAVLEDRPRLPARPELQSRGGRISPGKSQSGRTSPGKRRDARPKSWFDVAASSRDSVTPSTSRSALTQGFDRVGAIPTAAISSAASDTTPTTLIAPAVPPPRRSMEKRRPEPTRPTQNTVQSSVTAFTDNSSTGLSSVTHSPGLNEYPDATQANRRPPQYPRRPFHIAIGYDTKLLSVCGEYVCTSGYLTKVWQIKTGEQVLNMSHDEHIKVTSIAFKPTVSSEDEGKQLWLGTNIGEIYEVDIPTKRIVKSRPNAHGRREVVRIFRHASQLWTLDDTGDLNVWKADQSGLPNLHSRVSTFKVPRMVSCAVKCGHHLWIASGRDIRIFRPGAEVESDFAILRHPLSQAGAGDITCGATLSSTPDLVYFGHSDGKVSIYHRYNFSCLGVINASVYKIITMAGVGNDLWLGYSTGMIYILDTSSRPWRVKKAWQAHEKQVCSIIADSSATWKFDRLQVITLGTDSIIRIWDGLLEEDWLESRMIALDTEYCSFRELTAAVLTWNAGASKPHYLQHSIDDSGFFQDYMRSFQPAPDIFVFGFQELVDLEDKRQTAKSFFKSKKKDTNELEHMTHQYRAWRDHLTKCLDDYMPTDETYNLLHSASMVGLFTCVFAKSSVRNRVRHVHAAEVKRGMGGRHGNKGALIMRMVLDDSSVCFINCHLAAGQTQTLNRNNDIAGILESECLPAYPLSQNSVARHNDVFASGGDGSMILDHDICILNGDLNYRIDTMGRDTVVKMVENNNLARLLERDQLLLSKKKNPGFRLRAFEENAITFAPTYKYNVRSDEYDTSEKRRAPAWCDRILYRGVGKVVKLEAYRRWELRVSDHRPVSGHVRMRVKTVDPGKRAKLWERCRQEFAHVRAKLANEVQLDYLTNVLGLTRQEAAAALMTQ